MITLVVTPASPQEPASTPIPTNPTGLPLLCVSQRVLRQRLAGANNDSPARLTPPVSAATLFDKATAQALCEMLFGNGFQPTEASDQVATWAEFLPADATCWLWAGAGPVSAPE